MRILALDTSCATASCAVAENGQLLGEAFLHGARTHSQKLLPMISDLLAQLGMSPSGMDLFAVSSGPGSFTGLRIGVVTAKALAYAAGRPLVGISTLEALAYTIPAWKGVVCPVIDARNQQAFCSFYERIGREPVQLAPDTVLHVDALSDALAAFQRDVLLVGDCASRFVPLIRERWTGQGHPFDVMDADSALFTTRAAVTALLAEKKHPSGLSGAPGEAGDPFALEPCYLRSSQAEQRRVDGPVRQDAALGGNTAE